MELVKILVFGFIFLPLAIAVGIMWVHTLEIFAAICKKVKRKILERIRSG